MQREDRGGARRRRRKRRRRTRGRRKRYMYTSDKGTVYRYIHVKTLKRRRLNTAEIIGTLDSTENATLGPSFVAT